MSVPHPKGRNIVCACAKDNITELKEGYEAIGMCGFDYKLFKEDEVGGLERYYMGILILSI